MCENKIKYLPWDSEFFNRKIGQIVINEADSLEDILSEAKKSDYRLIYVFGNETFYVNNNLLKQYNGRLTDRKVLFEKRIEKAEEQSSSVYEYISKELPLELEQLAYESGEYSRFKVDMNFNQDDFYRMYKIWISKSLTGEMADKVFVVKENDAVRAMVTLKIDRKKGAIGLIAVSPESQRNGYGKALMNACENELFGKSIPTLEVSTQIDNIQACKFYEKCGFNIKKITNIYHFWI